MSQSAYPAAADLSAYLTDGGITPPSSITLNAAVAWAQTQWERKTHWVPFLSTGATETRYFDPPGPRPTNPQFLALRGGGKVLELDAGLLSITSLSVMSTTYTQGMPGDTAGVGNYWLQPTDAPKYNRPYEYIEFWAPVLGSPQTGVITGVWGFGLTIPDDAWWAILNGAAWQVMRTVGAKRSQGAARRTQGEVAETYAFSRDAGAYAFEAGQMDDAWQAGIKSYRRNRWGV